MEPDIYDELLGMVKPLIQKHDTNMRLSISASTRLAVTLRFFATGDSYQSLAALFRIAPNTISIIVPPVRCNLQRFEGEIFEGMIRSPSLFS